MIVELVGGAEGVVTILRMDEIGIDEVRDDVDFIVGNFFGQQILPETFRDDADGRR